VRAEAVASDALKRAERCGDATGMSIAWGVLGRVAKAQGRREEAIACLTEGLSHPGLTAYVSIWGLTHRMRKDLAWARGDLAEAARLALEGKQRALAAGIPFVVAGDTTTLGHLAQQQGNYAEAEAAYREALELYQTFGLSSYTSWCREGVAAVLCAEMKYHELVRLCAAAAALREQNSTPLPPAERANFEQALASARIALGDADFEREWAIGAEYEQQAAIDYALSALPASA